MTRKPNISSSFPVPCFIALALLLLSGVAGSAADQSEAVAALEKLGAKIEVAASSADKPVVKVNLRNKPVQDADLGHLKHFTKLQELHLGGTKITGRGLEHLQGLTDLRKLILDRTEVTDESLKHLRPLTNLRWLNVCETPVTDAGVKHLKGFKKLEYLDLSVRGDSISDAAISDLKKALPNVKIDR